MLGTQVVAGENALTSTYLLKAVTVPYLEGKFTCWNAGFSNNQFERFFATFLLMTWLDRCKFVPFLGMYFSAVLCNTPILHPLSDWPALFNQLLPWQYRHINRMSLLRVFRILLLVLLTEFTWLCPSPLPVASTCLATKHLAMFFAVYLKLP